MINDSLITTYVYLKKDSSNLKKVEDSCKKYEAQSSSKIDETLSKIDEGRIHLVHLRTTGKLQTTHL